MTTEEFIKKVIELGYKCGETDSVIMICTKKYGENGERYREVAIVSKVVQGRAEIICAFGDVTLMTQIVKYIATPIEERESQRYFKYQLKKPLFKKQQSGDNWLNFDVEYKRYFLNVLSNTDSYQTIFEENDPLLGDNVNLEMFDAIEVDADGNEI